MTPLQAQILRALKVPMTQREIPQAIAKMDARREGRVAMGVLLDMRAAHLITETVTATGLEWSRTPVGTEAMAAIESVPVDPANERESAVFEEPS